MSRSLPQGWLLTFVVMLGLAVLQPAHPPTRLQAATSPNGLWNLTKIEVFRHTERPFNDKGEPTVIAENSSEVVSLDTRTFSHKVEWTHISEHFKVDGSLTITSLPLTITAGVTYPYGANAVTHVSYENALFGPYTTEGHLSVGPDNPLQGDSDSRPKTSIPGSLQTFNWALPTAGRSGAFQAPASAFPNKDQTITEIQLDFSLEQYSNEPGTARFGSDMVLSIRAHYTLDPCLNGTGGAAKSPGPGTHRIYLASIPVNVSKFC